MALNLLPVPPLDGAAAWRVVPEMFGRAKRRIVGWRRRPVAPAPAAAARATPSQKNDYANVANVFQQISDDARRARRSR
jgi:hypothetical protein